MTTGEKCVIMFLTVILEVIFVEYKANSGIWGTMFGVPFVVADNFLKLATGQQLKVLLYLLRCSGRSCTDDEIALNTGVSAQEAADAVLFWQQVNVLSPQRTAQEQIPQQTAAEPVFFQPVSPVQEKPAVTELPADDSQKLPSRQRRNLTPSEISRIMKDQSDVAELFKVAESALGTLNHTQQDSIIWMYDYLGLKKEVIVTLLFYCKGIDKTNPRYIEKIAYSWSENDINTLAAAEEEVARLGASKEFTGKIMTIFEMAKSPTPKQAAFIEQWKSDGFSIELIKLAYEKTLDNINKLSFDYINKVLLSWKDKGYTTPAKVKEAEESFRRNRNTGSDSSPSDPDIEKYKVLMNKFDL